MAEKLNGAVDQRSSLLAARGFTDDSDCLLSADEALADLHERCGGSIPGVLAIPELLDLVKQGRALGLRIAREFSCFDGEELVSGFARIDPISDGANAGCELLIDNWQRSAVPQISSRDLADQIDAIDRASADVTALLDSRQCVQLLTGNGHDTADLVEYVKDQPGRIWTDYVSLHDVAHQQPLHWRLLDGAACTFEGSRRQWRARMIPVGPAAGSPRSFELLLVADEPHAAAKTDEGGASLEGAQTRLIGSALAPVLRQPIAGIIANAETIKARLAGPLRAEYSDYAGNIAAAGQHLSEMLDDLTDLEVVEATGFRTLHEEVDLGDATRRAAGILGVRAQARDINLVLPSEDERAYVNAEFRRVLQILINLIGNAISYSPEGSTVIVGITEDADGEQVALTVSDQGPGVSEEQAKAVFEKFERLGRDNDGGSGLGLYISRKLARAMDGELGVAQPTETEQSGACFRLALPRYS